MLYIECNMQNTVFCKNPSELVITCDHILILDVNGVYVFLEEAGNGLFGFW